MNTDDCTPEIVDTMIQPKSEPKKVVEAVDPDRDYKGRLYCKQCGLVGFSAVNVKLPISTNKYK